MEAAATIAARVTNLIMESAIGLANHVLRTESKRRKKLWQMKMKLFVSFFISVLHLMLPLQSLIFLVVVAGKINWCYGFTRLLLSWLFFAFCRIMSFSCKMEIDGRAGKRRKKERKNAHHPATALLFYTASLHVPSVLENCLLFVF